MRHEVGMLTLGVDLGGTKVETGLVDGEGRIQASHRYPTDPAQGASGVIADIVACVKGCIGEAVEQALALGIGVAGQVEGRSGTVRFAPNLGWRDVPLRAELEKSLGMPVVVANDVRAATWAEWLYGAGQGVDDLICLFIGTGIGGGVISGGRLLEGCNNSAGELGHLTVAVGGRKCHCPNQGCLEAYAGGWAIAERAQEAVQFDPTSGQALMALAGSAESITAATVSQGFRSGDPLARRLIEETGQYLTGGVVSIINAFNPGLLILGGGVIEGLPELVYAVEQGLRQQALEVAVEGLKVVTAALGGQAGVIGAAALAREAVG